MKKLLVGLLVLGSFSSFAVENDQCHEQIDLAVKAAFELGAFNERNTDLNIASLSRGARDAAISLKTSYEENSKRESDIAKAICAENENY